MPTKDQKQASVAELQQAFGRAQMAVVTDYRGLSVAELTDLRRRVQKAGGDVTIAKNTLLKVATKGQENWAALDDLLAGPTAVVFGFDDVVGPAKALSDFAKEKRAVKIQIRGAVLEGKPVSPAGVEGLANLPSREVLLAQLAGVLQAPIRNIVGVLAGPSRKIVYALEAVRKAKESA
ncbi:MAG: 50S ribosomal protein L10 [Candidatus Sericytochromatia bacterium]|nr:50S ribosomal protein L10 [Candidatus Sericytochromatia bacterium]